MTTYEKIKKLRFVWQGLVTWLPSMLRFGWQHQPQFTGSSVRCEVEDYKGMARTGYTVFLRCLAIANIDMRHVKAVAEIGPGDSLACGMAALLLGAEAYYPIDRLKRSLAYDNLKILEHLISLVRNQAPIPNDEEFPKSFPRLASYAFPRELVPDLGDMLKSDRLDAIRAVVTVIQEGNRRSVEHTESGREIRIEYPLPEDTPNVDLVVSNAVMEHVDGKDSFGEPEPGATYRRTAQMVRIEGSYVHTIGLNSHSTASQFNGQYTYSPLMWRIIRGHTRYLINRWPASKHEAYLRGLGFSVHAIHYKESNTLVRKDLAHEFRNLSKDDLETHTAVVWGTRLE